MNGNLKYTISDGQRLQLGVFLRGTRKLASRAEVCDFLLGALERAAAPDDGAHAPDAVPVRELPVWAKVEAERLTKQGKNESYIRGWLQVMARSRS